MFRITLICHGLPAACGEQAARDIAGEFASHRRWHKQVRCEWDGTKLILTSENDFDADGKATLHEFGDSIVAYIADPGRYNLSVESVETFT